MPSKLQIAAITGAAIAAVAFVSMVFSKQNKTEVAVETQTDASEVETKSSPVASFDDFVGETEQTEEQVVEETKVASEDEFEAVQVVAEETNAELIKQVQEWIAYDPNPKSRAGTLC